MDCKQPQEGEMKLLTAIVVLVIGCITEQAAAQGMDKLYLCHEVSNSRGGKLTRKVILGVNSSALEPEGRSISILYPTGHSEEMRCETLGTEWICTLKTDLGSLKYVLDTETAELTIPYLLGQWSELDCEPFDPFQ
jgi:hypothetical protein